MKTKRVFDCHCGEQPILRSEMRCNGRGACDKEYWYVCPNCGVRNTDSTNRYNNNPEKEAKTIWNEMILEHRGKIYVSMKKAVEEGKA